MNLQPKNNKKSEFLKYSAIASQMLGTIGVGVFLGLKLDASFETKQPLFTIFLSLLSIGLALFFVIRKVMND